jgi:hypothetical protein
MDTNDRPAEPPDTQASTVPSGEAARSTGFRHSVLTAGMAAALLLAGGASAVAAASPDPSASATPAPADASDDGSSGSIELGVPTSSGPRELPAR